MSLQVNALKLISYRKADLYGIDYGGPVSVDTGETVILDDIQILSQEQCLQLKRLLGSLLHIFSSQEAMLAQYTVARSFCYQTFSELYN